MPGRAEEAGKQVCQSAGPPPGLGEQIVCPAQPSLDTRPSTLPHPQLVVISATYSECEGPRRDL